MWWCKYNYFPKSICLIKKQQVPSPITELGRFLPLSTVPLFQFPAPRKRPSAGNFHGHARSEGTMALTLRSSKLSQVSIILCEFNGRALAIFFPSANVFFSGTNAIFLLSILARHSRECKGYMSIIFTLSYLIFLAFSFFLFFFNFCEHQVCLLTMFSTDESCWWHSMIFLRIWIGN